ncbi:hypothetical protein FPV67DRAFT_1447197 [Lyophyllum atratum]|nr:hypothetical protein FPV67DRAFT_1447197 [Lyophyllum atratum]
MEDADLPEKDTPWSSARNALMHLTLLAQDAPSGNIPRTSNVTAPPSLRAISARNHIPNDNGKYGPDSWLLLSKSALTTAFSTKQLHYQGDVSRADVTIYSYDRLTSAKAAVLSCHAPTWHTMAFFGTTSYIVTSVVNNTNQVQNSSSVATENDVEMVDPPTDSISSMEFSSQADFLAVGSWDNSSSSSDSKDLVGDPNEGHDIKSQARSYTVNLGG